MKSVESLMESILTTHASKRGHQRLGFRGAALERTAAKALERGVRMAATSGQLYRYLESILKPGCILRVWAEHVYIFGSVAPHPLITVYYLPHELKAAARRAATVYHV